MADNPQPESSASVGSTGKRATIYDIARVTGLSPSTVSRALSKPGRVSAATERRVKETAEILGYEANPIARALPTGRTGGIGLAVPAIDHPVFSGLVQSVERAAMESGYKVTISETGNWADVGAEAIRRLSPLVDAMILVSPLQDERTLWRLADRKPVVVINRPVPGIESIVPDLTGGYRGAVEHLVAEGHEAVAFIPSHEASWTSEQRSHALASEASRAGMSFVETRPGRLSVSEGATNLAIALETGVKAIFTYNDLIAVGILHACHARGIDVPDRFSLIGYDDIFGADFVIPTLSTIRPPLPEMGRCAFIAAMRQLGDDLAPCGDLETVFILRDSSGRIGTTTNA